MATHSDNWPESRPDLMRAIVRKHDETGGKGPTTVALRNPASRPGALINLASEVIRIERQRADRARMIAGIRRLGETG